MQLIDKHIAFIAYIINALANKHHISPSAIYRKLTQVNCIEKYLIPNYDTLHTLGEEYLTDDIEQYLKNRGVVI